MTQMTVDAASLDARGAQLRRIWARRKLLVPAAGLVIAAAVAVAIALNMGRQSPGSSGTGSLSGEASYAGLTLRFPAEWHAVNPTFLTGAMAYPLGWITNAEPGPQCTAGPRGHVSCHGPVTHLGAGVVQIALTSAGVFPAGIFHANTRLAGLPAQRFATSTGCQPSAVDGFTIIVEETPTSGVRLNACFGPNTATQKSQVQAILNAASYRHP